MIGQSLDALVADALALAPSDLLIGGEWRPAASGARFEVEDPATEQTIAEVADGDPEDGMAALAAAAGAAPAWAASTPGERRDLLRRAYELVADRAEALAVLMTAEMGKPIAQSRGEVAYAGNFLRWYSEEAVRADGRIVEAPEGDLTIATVRQPVGPCVLITPWNFPLAMPARKLAPALAAGCTAVLKPAELTPLCALAFARILEEAGVPAGVVNVVPTTSPGAVVAPLLANRRTRKLSFTGSTAVGQLLLAQAAGNVLRTSMELGGNAPFLVFADADLDEAVEGALLAKMRNTGEACTAANRFYVDRSVADEFSERLAARMVGMPIGHGLDEAVEVGPLIDERAVAKAARILGALRDEGARVVGAAPAVDGPGHFFAPVVVGDVPADSRALREEIFAPVAPIIAFDSEADAVRMANDSEFGLVSYLYTRDLDRAAVVSEALESGMVGVNTGVVSNVAAPFGGVKWSGLGREGGSEGLAEFQEIKYVATKRRPRAQ
jgi:succinate-semialdehyde dehydrogenase/glutarate-semialdehyde dehydrogenase